MTNYENIPPIYLEFSDPKREAMSTPKIWGLINYLARQGNYYLEVGSWCGATLCAAAHDNPDVWCIGIENYALAKTRSVEKVAWQRERLFENVLKYENTSIFEQDYREVLPSLASEGFLIDTYLYDGEHTYEEQLNGLELALPLLSPGAFVIVDDVNWELVKQANDEFKARHGFETVFCRLTPGPGRSHLGKTFDYWNGIEIMKRK